MFTLFQPVSYKKGAALAVGATAFWKLCSFLNSILIALYFGTKTGTDVYFYLIMLIGFGVTFLQKMNTSVLVPEAMCAEREKPGAGRKLLNAFLYFYLALGLCVMAAGVWLPVQSGVLLSRFSAQTLSRHEYLLGAAFILFASNLWVAYLTNVLEMHKRFGVALLAPLNALVPLGTLLLFGKQIGIISMVYGFLGANLIQLVCFLVILKRELRWDFVPGLEHFHARLKKNLLSNQTLEIVGLANSLIPVYLISGLGTGLISALNYAKQLSDSPTEIITNRLSSVSKIQLSEDASRKEWDSLNAHFLRTGRLLLFIITPLAAFTFFYAADIITLFFKRGHFTALSVQNAAAFLRPLMLLMWMMVPILMQSNALAAARKFKEAFGYLLFSNLLFTAGVIWAVHRWGAFAYPYTQVICCGIGFGINGLLFKKHLPFIAYGQSFKDAGRIAAENILALLPAALLTAFIPFPHVFFKLLAAGLVFLCALALLTRAGGTWQTLYFSSFFRRNR